MNHWLLRKSPYRLLPDIESGSPLADLLRQCTENGIGVTLLACANDSALPCAIAILQPQPGRAGVQFAIGSAAGWEWGAAVYHSVMEALVQWVTIDNAIRTVAVDEMKPHNVISLLDHALIHQGADSRKERDFLFLGPQRSQKSLPGPSQTDRSLKHLVALLGRQGLEIVVVDLTTHEATRCGLHVARTIIPGMVPLVADHRALPLGARAIRHAPSVNLFPHPFT